MATVDDYVKKFEQMTDEAMGDNAHVAATIGTMLAIRESRSCGRSDQILLKYLRRAQGYKKEKDRAAVAILSDELIIGIGAQSDLYPDIKEETDKLKGGLENATS